jgi:hypothetical protein
MEFHYFAKRNTDVASEIPKSSSVNAYEVVSTVGGLSTLNRNVVVSNTSVPKSLKLLPAPKNCKGTPVATPAIAVLK